MKKSIKIVILLVIIILLIGLAYFMYLGTNKKEEKNIISAYDEIFEIQKEVDKEIEEYIKDKQYTINNPKVILNPYKIAPLTALVIFQTEEEVSTEVKVNDKTVTNIESSKEHSIPIYGMYADYENKIELVLSSGENKELYIKTDKYDGDPITLEKTTEEVENNLYFVSPNFVNDCIIDGKGNVVWYISGGYAGDIEFLENGHFYISDPNQGKNGVKINYSSFLEMDYLGKIYNQWITDYGLHHELVPLSNNKMMVLGANDDSDFFDSYIYIMDLQTGKVIQYIDLYELLHNIDPELIEGLGTDFDLVNNSADYNEETGDLLISLRGLNSLIKLNFNTKEIKWIFGDPEFWGEKFSQYMLKVEDNTRFLGGQHSAFITDNGLIGVHNNDIDQFDLDNSNLSHYLDRYTTCDLYYVDEENKTIKTVWQYTANKEFFSNVGGHMEILENDNKLITYGWAMKREAYENPSEILYTDPNYKNGVIIQIDKNSNVLFKASMPGLIYRTFKIDGLYDNKTKNFETINFKRINGSNINGDIIETSSISKQLKKAEEYKNKIEITTNRVYINNELLDNDIADILFVGANNITYKYSYKKAGKKAPKSFNSGFASIQVNIPEGNYDIFIKINDTYYNTNLNVKF